MKTEQTTILQTVGSMKHDFATKTSSAFEISYTEAVRIFNFPKYGASTREVIENDSWWTDENTALRKLTAFNHWFYCQCVNVQDLVGNLQACRIDRRDDWLVYDIAQGQMDAIYVGMIPSVFVNTSLAKIVRPPSKDVAN